MQSTLNRVVFSSARQDWATPQRFFDAIDDEFGFTLDACALPENAKCFRYYTPHDDALSQPWPGVVWMNPPYGYQIGKWVRKAYEESQTNARFVVGLIPAKTDTSWWHDYVMRAAEIRFIRGRLRFGGVNVNAPFPSAVVVWSHLKSTPDFSVMDRILDAA